MYAYLMLQSAGNFFFIFLSLFIFPLYLLESSAKLASVLVLMIQNGLDCNIQSLIRENSQDTEAQTFKTSFVGCLFAR